MRRFASKVHSVQRRRLISHRSPSGGVRFPNPLLQLQRLVAEFQEIVVSIWRQLVLYSTAMYACDPRSVVQAAKGSRIKEQVPPVKTQATHTTQENRLIARSLDEEVKNPLTNKPVVHEPPCRPGITVDRRMHQKRLPAVFPPIDRAFLHCRSWRGAVQYDSRDEVESRLKVRFTSAIFLVE